MKTKNLLKFALILAFAAGFVLTGCRKDKKDADTTNLQQTSKDQITLKAADDMATNDINKVLSGGGGKEMLWVPCNATLDSVYTIADTVTYVVTYNGLNCEGNYNRVGTVEAHKCITTHWADAGAVAYIKFIDFKVTRVTDGRWAVVNGIKRYENESGGLLINLGGSLTSITHRVTGTLNATFDDNTTRAWNVARRKTYTGSIGNLYLSFEGLGTADGYTSLESWGVNRNGDNYYNRITAAVVLKEVCSWDAASGSGIIDIPADEISATLTFGYDSNETLVDLNGTTCPTHYRVDWVKGDNSGTIYIAL
jgi:hypothetical protein